MKTQKKIDATIKDMPSTKGKVLELMTEAQFKEFCRKRREKMSSAA